MTFGLLLSNVMRISVVTLLSEIAMKAIDQKDYSNLIKFSGICAISTEVASYMAYLNAHPPVLLTLTKASFSGWSSFFKTVSGIGK